MAKNYNDMPITQGTLTFSYIILAFIALISLIGVLFGTWMGADRMTFAMLLAVSTGLAGICAGIEMIITTMRHEEENRG